MVQQPLVGQGFIITKASRLHSIGLLWTSNRPEAETSTGQHATLTRDRHPCQRRDSNSQYQQAKGRTPAP
jgi:hypothetical protein